MVCPCILCEKKTKRKPTHTLSTSYAINKQPAMPDEMLISKCKFCFSTKHFTFLYLFADESSWIAHAPSGRRHFESVSLFLLPPSGIHLSKSTRTRVGSWCKLPCDNSTLFSGSPDHNIELQSIENNVVSFCPFSRIPSTLPKLSQLHLPSRDQIYQHLSLLP